LPGSTSTRSCNAAAPVKIETDKGNGMLSPGATIRLGSSLPASISTRGFSAAASEFCRSPRATNCTNPFHFFCVGACALLSLPLDGVSVAFWLSWSGGLPPLATHLLK
jgi:hypothetical protein